MSLKDLLTSLSVGGVDITVNLFKVLVNAIIAKFSEVDERQDRQVEELQQSISSIEERFDKSLSEVQAHVENKIQALQNETASAHTLLAQGLDALKNSTHHDGTH